MKQTDQFIYEDVFNNEMLLACPTCALEFTHHRKTTEYQREKEDGPTVAVTVEQGGSATMPSVYNPSQRRHAVSLTFECEAGHWFSLQFIQHKGQTIIEVAPEDAS